MDCSPITRLLFIGMWNFADDHGRMPFAPRTIKAQVFPADDISADCVRGMLAELSAKGLILVYAVGGKEYLEITGWKHQRIDRPQDPRFPGPMDDGVEAIRRTFDDHSTLEKEGKGREKEEEHIRAVGKPTRTVTSDEFEEWWKVIPKRGSAANPKKPAREKFGRLIRDGTPVGDLMRAGRLWRDAEIAGKRDGTEKVAQAITWLNQERWNDYLAAVEVVEDKTPEPPPGGPTDAELRAKYVATARDHEPGSESVFRSGDGARQANEGERSGRQVPIVQARAARVSGVGGVFRPIGVAAGRLAIVPGRHEPDDDVPDAMATVV